MHRNFSMPLFLSGKSGNYANLEIMQVGRLTVENYMSNYRTQYFNRVCIVFVKSLPARGDFCHLLQLFATSLDPDQARHVGPDLDLICLTL